MATDPQPTYTDLNRSVLKARRGAPAPAALARRDLWLPATLLFCAVFALYWGTRTAYNTFDAVSYANQIAHLYPQTGDRRWLFHPHHLLFNALGFLLWRFARALGYTGGPLMALQSLNATLGAAGVVVFYLTGRRVLQRSRWLPFLIAVGLALSFGYWICATDGRVNMPSTFLLLCAFGLLCRLMENAQTKLAAWIGALAGAAVLFHESAGLFLPVGLAGIWLAEPPPLALPEVVRRGHWRMTLTFLGVWLAVVGLPYLLVGTVGLGLHSPREFHRWLSSYSELGWWWDFDILKNLRLDAYALRHAAFVEPPGKQGTFHVNPTSPLALTGLYVIALLGWLVSLYAFCAALPLLWRSYHRRIVIVCLLWSGLYAAFFTVWSPGYFVFWTPVLIPTGLLLALTAAHYRARRLGVAVNWLLGVWVALYGVVNLTGSIVPHLRADASPFRRMALDVRAHTQPGDIVVVAGAGDGGQCEVDIPYFADRAVVSVHGSLTTARDDKSRAGQVMQAQIENALQTGHSVYALDELWNNSHTWNDLHKHHSTFAYSDLQTVFAPYQIVRAWRSPRGPVWQFLPRSGTNLP